MVLQNAHASSRFTRPRPDPVRIAGISGTLALNLVALLLLLVPISQTALRMPSQGPAIPISWIETPPPPPAPPPAEVPVIQPRPVPVSQPRTITAPEPTPAIVEPAIVEHGELPATAVAAPDPGTHSGSAIETGPSGPGMRLEYAHATPPPYPGAAIRGNLQGTVLLEVLVGEDGRPIDVRIHGSSGHRMLDAAARRHVLREWTFRPAVRDGRPVQAIGIVPIDFHLDRN